MNRVLFMAFMLSEMAVHAQVKDGMVGINTNEPRATLHIEPGASESKGLIIPRITAVEMVNMSNLSHFGADQHAIITYLKESMPSIDRTGKLVDVDEPGYYYYDNTIGVKKWKKLGGTASAVQDLRMVGSDNHITQDAGVGGNGTNMGTGISNIAIGKAALNSITSGNHNIAMGENALKANTTGGYNMAYGLGALYRNTTGSNNTAIGLNALHLNTTGDYNFAIGESALYPNTTGSKNMAIGYSAGQWIKGDRNIHIGIDDYNYIPPMNGQLNKVIFIGHLDSANQTLDTSTANSNVILLGDETSDAPNVGIGTYKPVAKLDIKGPYGRAIRIADGTQGQGKVLTSDADGLATWKRQALTLVEGVKGSGINIPPSTGGYIYTGSYITLPPGKYMVSVQNLMSVGFATYSDGHFWLRTTFSDSDTTFARTNDIDSTKGFLISGLLPQGARFSMLSGSLIIENTTSSPKTYYYWAGQVDVTSGTTTPLQNFGNWSEWSMTATPIQ